MSRTSAEKRAVGTLVVQQDKAVAALRRSFRRRSDETRDPTPSSRTDAELTAVLLLRRQAARSAARRRLAGELRDIGVEVRTAQWEIASRYAVDLRRAQDAAASLTKQWRAIASSADDEKLSKTPSVLMRDRLERTARTEVATAYSEEHREALRDLARHDNTFGDGKLADAIGENLRRRWSAMADACERCWPMDGEEVGIFETFSGGEPGGVHPRCLCVEYLVAV